ncbi:WD40-repeat-containing domain protein [Spinellus fusiger]|nr:WD40-repeat-containing domain protein [Spinellus fusiger]
MPKTLQHFINNRQNQGLSDLQYGDISTTHFEEKIYADEYTMSRMTLEREMKGHHGCVNTLCWSSLGDKLVSGSDDKTMIIWNTYDNFQKALTINTGHSANIFSTKFMPYTSDTLLISAAADAEVRVFDISKAISNSTRNTLIKVYNCHTESVKQIATHKTTPYEFLTCAEDGTVRHYDIRQPHTCTQHQRYSMHGTHSNSDRHTSFSKDLMPREGCPAPLLDYSEFDIRFNSISINPSNPHYFALAGMNHYMYLNDRRMVGRINSIGARKHSNFKNTSLCIKRFEPRNSHQHSLGLYVTSCKFSEYNSNELLGSWSSGEIGLFNIHDEVKDSIPKMTWHQGSDDKCISSYHENAPTMKEISQWICSNQKERALGCLRLYTDPYDTSVTYSNDIAVRNLWSQCLTAALCFSQLYEPEHWDESTFQARPRPNEEEFQKGLKEAHQLLQDAELTCPKHWRAWWCLAVGMYLSGGGPCKTSNRHREEFLIKAKHYVRNAIENHQIYWSEDRALSPSSIHISALESMKMFNMEVVKALEYYPTATLNESELLNMDILNEENGYASIEHRWRWIDIMYQEVIYRENHHIRLTGESTTPRSTSPPIFRSISHSIAVSSQETNPQETDQRSPISRLEALLNNRTINFLGSSETRDSATESTGSNPPEREARPQVNNSTISATFRPRRMRRSPFVGGGSRGSEPRDRIASEQPAGLHRGFTSRLHRFIEEDTPIRKSKASYYGHCNIMTTKEVNFYGPNDEYIVSGSDDGMVFVWDKKTTKIVQILKGDVETVNVIQGHPTLPLMAVSGIDSTVKIFKPIAPLFTTSCHKEPFLPSSYSPSSRMYEKESIVKRNEKAHKSEPLMNGGPLYMDVEPFSFSEEPLSSLMTDIANHSTR